MTAAPSLTHDLSIPPSVEEYLAGFPGYLTPEAIALHSGNIARAYLEERVAKKDWPTVSRVLTKSPKSVLDIGGGIGAVSLLLAKFGGIESVTLVEKETRDTVAGNTVHTHRCARELFSTNGVDATKLELIEVYDDHLLDKLSAKNFDLVISLRALGFLFPYETYRPALLKCLRPNGQMLLDIRKLDSYFVNHSHPTILARFSENKSHLEVIEDLRRDFGNVSVLTEGPNSCRVLVSATRP